MESILWIVLAYFIGAIPSGYLIGRIFYGVNLKKWEAVISAPPTPIGSWGPKRD